MPIQPPSPESLALSPNTVEEAERYRAPALDKGLDILELLAEQKEGLTRTEITKRLGRNASEIYRMLERLVARRYVTRSDNDRYTLSIKLFALAHQHPPMNRLITEALPPMQRFADAAEQSCHLSIYDRGGLLVIAQVDDPGTLGISVRPGSRIGLVDTASGHLILALQTPDARKRMLDEHATPNDATPFDTATFDTNAAAARQHGYLRHDNRRAFGVIDIACPILGPSGHAIAALTCPYVRRIDGHAAPSIDGVAARLQRTADGLSTFKRRAA